MHVDCAIAPCLWAMWVDVESPCPDRRRVVIDPTNSKIPTSTVGRLWGHLDRFPLRRLTNSIIL